MLKEYDKMIDFVLNNDEGKEISDKHFYGKYTVLYFYPKAFTPGCTKECNAFSENIDEFISFKMSDLKDEVQLNDEFKDQQDFNLNDQKTGEGTLPEVQVVGISPDSPESLIKFRQKYDLKVELLSDPEKKVAKGFSALKEKGSSILRSTFILDPWNRVRKSWYGVKVKGHVEEVLAELKRVIVEDISINPQIEERRARRSFAEDMKVPESMITQLIQAAHLAPSCFNNQPWRFSVINDSDKLNELAESIPSGNYWLKKAPVLIAVHSQEENDCQLSDRRDYYLFDTGIAVGNLLTQATQMGLIAHPVAGYDPEGFKEKLNIAEDHVLITVIGVGFPADVDYLSEQHQRVEESPRDRLDLAEVINWNGYKNI
ncbi:MAG: redoxin domain-containing protein [Halanaerobiales bacterium]